MAHFLVFGTHPALALAEARAVLGGPKPLVMQELAVFERDEWDGAALQERLAGTVKLGEIVAELPVRELTVERLAEIIRERPREERVLFGLTVYGTPAERRKRQRLPLQLKRRLQEAGRSVRWVTGEAGGISPAAIAKMKLTAEGYDLVIGIDEDRAFVGLTTHVQDADAWSLRDYGRPFRDAKTGMLPPKLARLMVNLGVGAATELSGTLLDPFCGSGTILMEAALMGVAPLIGSDLESGQINGAEKNLDWLVEKKLLTKNERERISLIASPVETVDRQVPAASVDAIVTEGYLGKPLRGGESLAFLRQQAEDITALWREALRVAATLLKPHGRVVCVWPVFVSPHGAVAVDLKHELTDLGYRLIDPLGDWHDKTQTLTYARPDQRVKRNVLVLEKIQSSG